MIGAMNYDKPLRRVSNPLHVIIKEGMARILKRHSFFEDVLGSGVSLNDVERPYTDFANTNPRVQAYRVNLEDVHLQLVKREQERRLAEEIIISAFEQGIFPGEIMIQR